ncbi:hypothetical protein Q8F55_005439 [Vanrija albida]|uniref:Saccharopine dehydrogenase (NADP(+), L-lysine-forming) n=1 Tax=Vanrija albida TaxID=181172 RepID=A0ABR3Q1N5_9TREE
MLSSLRTSRLAPLRQASSSRALSTLGIRREDPGRVWERRAPLTPDAVRQLNDISKVEVESCTRRCFPDSAYEAAGARIVPTLSPNVDVVLGIKEPRVKDVHALIGSKADKHRTWMMFSHTHKGQPYNTGLLSSFLAPTAGQTLIDHELLTAPTEKGDLQRVAAFGWYAGAVGAGEALSLLGLALLKRGIAHPFLHLPRPYTFDSLADFKKALGAAGDQIRKGTGAGSQGPIVIGLTGAGNVSTGAREMLEALGVQWVSHTELPTLKDGPVIYATQLPGSAYFQRKGDGGYDRSEYFSSPDKYTSVFADKIAPYLTCLIHGAGWSAAFPRILTNTQTDGLIRKAGGAGNQKLVAVQDVSCDIGGALEFMTKSTTIDEPSFEGPGGILIGSTDILPTELPADASGHFSKHLLPYVTRALLHADGKGFKGDQIDATLDRAQIVSEGVLQKPYEWLGNNVAAWRAAQPQAAAPAPVAPVSALASGSYTGFGAASQQRASSTIAGRGEKKRVLLLGSGLVAGPAVDVFLARPNIELVIASNNIQEANGLARGRDHVKTALLDVSDDKALGEAVSHADVVVSLLPAPMHPAVAKHCIAHGRHLVTASYVSPEMKELNDEAEKRDVLLLGECGLDPGIDSMAAMRILERVKKEGKKVTSFVSWCGGLPEPSATTVPLAYKFSWSPKAVLTAALNDAHYKIDGKVTKVAGDDLLAQHFPKVNLWPGLALEGLANRDSMPYAEKYGLPPASELKDLFRGTLRYQGFSTLLDSFRRLGLLGKNPLASPVESWQGFLAASMSQQLGATVKERDLLPAIKDVLGSKSYEEAVMALEWFSLLPPNITNPPVAAPAVPKQNTPIDLFATLLSKKLAYAPGEHDTCLLHHAFKLVPANAPVGTPEQTVTASLLCTGDEKASAMSTTVGCTLAFAALRVAEGKVAARGVRGPYERDVWEGVLTDLEEIGVDVKETWA